MSAALLVAALALTGCTTGAGDTPEAVESAPVSAETVRVATPTKSVDIKAAKAEAIAAGRPEAAWDRKCVAWELPEAGDKAQAWANKLGAAWLGSHGASCPDQLPYPYYYVDSFKPGANGELVAVMDNASYASPDELAMMVMDELAEAHPELARVTARTQSGKFTGVYTRADFDRSRAVELGTYVYP
jgi:hypothetical protein